MKRRLAVVGLLLALSASLAWADRPHIDYTTQTKTTSAKDSATRTLWTPAAGHGFVLQGCLLNTTGVSEFRLTVGGVDIMGPIVFTSTGTQLIESGGAPLYTSARNATLDVTGLMTVATSVWSVMCWGYESVDLLN